MKRYEQKIEELTGKKITQVDFSDVIATLIVIVNDLATHIEELEKYVGNMQTSIITLQEYAQRVIELEKKMDRLLP